jgi:hypothetical protein
MIYRTTDRKQATWLYKRGYTGMDITESDNPVADNESLFVFDIPESAAAGFSRALRDFSQGKL